MSFRLLLVGVYAAAYARPIMRGVRYLQQKLRPQLEKLAGDFRILNSTFANPVRRADDRPRHTPVDAFSVPVCLLHCELDSWIENGQVTLARQLPFESPPSRPTHAALLLFAPTPGDCGRHANCVLVRVRLEAKCGMGLCGRFVIVSGLRVVSAQRTIGRFQEHMVRHVPAAGLCGAVVLVRSDPLGDLWLALSVRTQAERIISEPKSGI